MTKVAAPFFILVILTTTASCNRNEHHTPFITLEDIRAAESTQRPLIVRTLKMPDGSSIPVELNVTNKGNGVITLGSLMIRVYDTHDDGVYYKPGLLDVTLVMSQDNVIGVRFAGTELKTGDDADEVLSSADVEFICEYDTLAKDFVFVGGYGEQVWSISD